MTWFSTTWQFSLIFKPHQIILKMTMVNSGSKEFKNVLFEILLAIPSVIIAYATSPLIRKIVSPHKVYTLSYSMGRLIDTFFVLASRAICRMACRLNISLSLLFSFVSLSSKHKTFVYHSYNSNPTSLTFVKIVQLIFLLLFTFILNDKI